MDEGKACSFMHRNKSEHNTVDKDVCEQWNI